MDSTDNFSPEGEPHLDGVLTIPLQIRLNPASDKIRHGEIDLLMSEFDDILLEMQLLSAELASDDCVNAIC